MALSVKFLLVSLGVFYVFLGICAAYLLKPHMEETKHQSKVEKMFRQGSDEDLDRIELVALKESPIRELKGISDKLSRSITEVDFKLNRPVLLMSTLYNLVDEICRAVIERGLRAQYKDKLGEDVMMRLSDYFTEADPNDNLCRGMKAVF